MRKGYLILTSAVCVLLAVLLAAGAVGIFLDGSVRRAEDPTADIYTPENVAERLASLTPLFIALAVLLAAGLIPGLKDPKAGRPAKAEGPVKRDAGMKHEGRIRAILIAAAVVLIIAGILNGSARDVLVKAITICTECVGLG